MLHALPIHKLAHKHTHTQIKGASGTGHDAGRAEGQSPLPSLVNVWCCAGCTKLRGGFFLLHTVEREGMAQACFVLRGGAVRKVRAFCQQVRISSDVPTVTAPPLVALMALGLFELLVCGQWALVGRGELPAPIVCTDACSLFLQGL